MIDDAEAPIDPAPAAGFFMSAIGRVRTPFVELFGIPRQAALTDITARVELDPTRVVPEALRGLESVTHLWLLFVFDRVTPGEVHPTVRPPRLGGDRRMGVFATRSPFRPNPIGLSAVRLVAIEGLSLVIAGCDLADGTPILDIKPYVAGVDRLDDTRVGWLPTDDGPALAVRFEAAALAVLEARDDADTLRRALTQLLQLDPRPSHRRGEPEPARRYGLAYADLDVQFFVDAQGVCVAELLPAQAATNHGERRGSPPA